MFDVNRQTLRIGKAACRAYGYHTEWQTQFCVGNVWIAGNCLPAELVVDDGYRRRSTVCRLEFGMDRSLDRVCFVRELVGASNYEICFDVDPSGHELVEPLTLGRAGGLGDVNDLRSAVTFA